MNEHDGIGNPTNREYGFGGYRGFWIEAERLNQFGGLAKDRANLSIDHNNVKDTELEQYGFTKRATKFQPPAAKGPSSSVKKHFYPPGSKRPPS